MAWRIGANVLVKQLRPWWSSWLDVAVLGGVPDAAMILSAASQNSTANVAQDLSKFFDTVGWQLMRPPAIPNHTSVSI